MRINVNRFIPEDCNESFFYDKHGNITSICWRQGQEQEGEGYIDNLSFQYNGNQIKKITDHADSQNSYYVKEYQDLVDEQTEFFYDSNGNLITDLDRDIVTIRYNLLNLPDTIQFKNGRQIINRYDATGQKLSTMYVTPIYPLSAPLTAGATISTDNGSFRRYGTLYNANVEYTLAYNGNRTIARIHNAEGYTDTSGNLHYYRKDHLGNVREVWMLTQGVRQSTQYYAGGLPCYDADNDSYLQPYKFGGKEFIETHGYDSYDFHARMRMGAIPAFETPDPLAEIRPWESPYCYAGNNPVNRIDPDGRDWYEFQNENGSKAVLWQEGNAKAITIDEQVYNNIGTTYLAQYDWGAISFNQNEMDGFYPYTSVSDLSISDKGLNFLIDREGLKLSPYNDSKGFATIGVGHLIGKRAVTEQDKKDWAWFNTKQEAMSLLQTDLSGTYEKAVQSLVGVPLMQFQYDAIVSFTFNVGVGGLKQSNFLKELNKSNYNGSLMLNYRRPLEILDRRKKEVNLFNNARY
jgi:RHS repeat-associated protein